jgi:hypothetical protein
MATLVTAYDDLRVSPASVRTLPSGHRSTATYGPTGAAKTLFALRPNLVPPWDEPIRARFNFDGRARSFRSYLEMVAAQLLDLSAESGVDVYALPRLVGRAASSPPKLIDEYNWVVITKGIPPPTAEDLRTWTGWAEHQP